MANKEQEIRETVGKILGNAPFTVKESDLDFTAKTVVQGELQHDEIANMMALGHISIKRSGTGIGVAVKVAKE